VPQAQNLAIGSVGVGAAVLALKASAWAMTGSAALFSDAAETVVNIAASVVAYAALRVAAKPADANHPYGHAKAEFFAAVIEGGLVIAAALTILQHAWAAWWNPVPLVAPWRALARNATGGGVNRVWALLLRGAARRLRSPALAADAGHLLADVDTSAGVVAGVGLAALTGHLWLDPLLAAATAGWILYSGSGLVGESVGGLMDAAPGPEVVARIKAIVAEHAIGAIEAHDVRTRRAGRMTFLEFHLVVPGAMTVAASHDICDRLETALRAEMDGLMITIHVEPEGKAKHTGVLVL